MDSAPTRPAKKKVIETAVEPSYQEVTDTARTIDLLVSANADYSQFKCKTESVHFKDTLMLQTRVYEFSLQNKGTISMDYSWQVVMDSYGASPGPRSVTFATHTHTEDERPMTAATGAMVCYQTGKYIIHHNLMLYQNDQMLQQVQVFLVQTTIPLCSVFNQITMQKCPDLLLFTSKGQKQTNFTNGNTCNFTNGKLPVISNTVYSVENMSCSSLWTLCMHLSKECYLLASCVTQVVREEKDRPTSAASSIVSEREPFVPFSIEPELGTILPGKKADFKVKFSPLDVNEYEGRLVCRSVLLIFCVNLVLLFVQSHIYHCYLYRVIEQVCK